ncbi:MAG: D-glycero-beta-D-manno-heptose 1,7-bisphosphate 7-phosphatase [Desulfobacterales bacterium]|nr:D-glycero-beta-D-manno-heptose 1,7-bisphosphate 7-phosphatase [Desulfobacterales bacterium]
MLRNVVFLDRDGVINQDSADYIKGWSDFDFISRSVEAVGDLTRSGFTTIVITNQSAIARTLISAQELEYVHSKMKEAIESKGGKINDIFICPHLPSDGCDCRKPSPGLIYQAQRKYDIDLAASVMIGDSVRDIQCALNAGCGHSILVRTGNGNDAEHLLTEAGLFTDYVAEDLYDASQWLLNKKKGRI